MTGLLFAFAVCAGCGDAQTDTQEGSVSGEGTVKEAVGFVADGTTQEVEPNYIGTFIPTFSARTDDSYTVGLYIKGNAVVDEYSIYGDVASAGEDGVTLSDIAITAEGSGFTAVVAQATSAEEVSTVNIINTEILLTDDSDGTNACDFTGLGAAIVASGATEDAHILLNIDNVNVTTTGFVRDGIIVADDHQLHVCDQRCRSASGRGCI